MSRKGNEPITLPKGVEVSVSGKNVSVKGPKGLLTQEVLDFIKVDQKDGVVLVSLDSDNSDKTNFQGLFRMLIYNMVVGTTEGFAKTLKMEGVGFRAVLQGKSLNLQLGFSHPTLKQVPEGINVKVEKNTLIHISGINKQLVGQFAAEVRAMRPPEPYKGKGIRYQDEYVRRKAGKTAKK